MTASDHVCHFKWDNQYPFRSLCAQNAIFYDGTSSLTRWKVILFPIVRGNLWWKFEFRLEFDPSFDEPREIEARRVQIFICMNDLYVDYRDVFNFRFNRGNNLTYHFMASKRLMTGPDLLVVTIKLRLPGKFAVCQYPHHPFDLLHLSSDFYRLLINPIDSDMKLRSSDHHVFSVHYFIVYMRWKNFSTMPNVIDVNPRDVIQTNISTGILIGLLTYFYSGTVNFFWSNELYIAELFQVIEKYKLHPLYKLVVRDDLHQKRVTRKYVITQSCTFPLRYAFIRRNTPFSHTWHVNQNTPFELVFTLEEQKRNGGWLSYSLTSRSQIPVYAQVNLEIGKKVVNTNGAVNERTTIVLERYHIIKPSAVVRLGGVLFLACPEIFGDFIPINPHDQHREVEYYVRCVLKLTDELTIDLIHSNSNTFRDDLENINILGGQLLQLRRDEDRAFLLVIPQAATYETRYSQTFYIHKAILATRLRDWWRVFQLPATAEMPDVWESNFSKEALNFALDYIYSSKASHIPYNYVGQIARLADDGSCFALSDYIIRFCNEFDFDWPSSDDN